MHDQIIGQFWSDIVIRRTGFLRYELSFRLINGDPSECMMLPKFRTRRSARLVADSISAAYRAGKREWLRSTEDSDEERKEFEKWARKNTEFDLERLPNGEYVWGGAQWAWLGWSGRPHLRHLQPNARGNRRKDRVAGFASG